MEIDKTPATDADIKKAKDQLRRWWFGHPMDDLAMVIRLDDEKFDEIEKHYMAIQKILCEEGGHNVMDDQCGIPAHRYCLDCEEATPNAEVTPWEEESS